MDFRLSEEQEAFRATASAFAADAMAPHAERWDAEKVFPLDCLRAAAALGFAAIYVRDDMGGSGLGRLDAALIFEELAAACPSTAAYLSIHNMCAWMIDRFGDEAQRRRWLPDLCTLERCASYCLTEPGAGSDAASLRMQAVRAGDHYVLDGEKAFISGGGRADLYLVMARTGDAGPKGLSCFAVEAGTPGLAFGAQEKKMGWNSQPTAAVILDGCRVPAGNRLGDEGQGFAIAMAGLDGGRVNIGACSLGGARAAMDKALAYVKERRQFGQPIADFQATRFKLADMATDLEAARLLLHRAALQLDMAAPERSAAAAMAKRFATDVGFRVANEALQLLGGYGYIRDYGIERIVRDLRVHQILEGTNEIMRLIIARAVVDGVRRG